MLAVPCATSCYVPHPLLHMACGCVLAAMLSFAVYCLRQAVPSAQAWAWDKVAQMVKVLDETPPEQAEWILFMQPDTVIDDVAFTFPFEFYQVHDGRNLAHKDATASALISRS